jgi:hypothetical protein
LRSHATNLNVCSDASAAFISQLKGSKFLSLCPNSRASYLGQNNNKTAALFVRRLSFYNNNSCRRVLVQKFFGGTTLCGISFVRARANLSNNKPASFSFPQTPALVSALLADCMRVSWSTFFDLIIIAPLNSLGLLSAEPQLSPTSRALPVCISSVRTAARIIQAPSLFYETILHYLFCKTQDKSRLASGAARTSAKLIIPASSSLNFQNSRFQRAAAK